MPTETIIFRYRIKSISTYCLILMPQRTLRFKIHQNGRVEETVEGFSGNSCNDATKNVEDALGEVKVKNKTSEAFVLNQSEKSNQINNESNVTF